MKRHELDMTDGKIWPVLLAFTVPLLLENLLQLLYNTVDSIVVGRYVGMSALAAVSATTHICGMLVRFFNGTAVGAGVVISRNFGAKNKENLHTSIQTTMILTFVACIILTIIGIACSSWLLRKISTPPDVFEEADLYLKIYFGGISGLLIYNMGGAVLRAMGDSRRPLYFLIFCSILNIILDLIFVVYFHLGIAGVAAATVIAQMISALLVLYVLVSSTGALKKLKFDKKISSLILKIGLPVGLQMAIVAFSNVFVQAYVNYFGTACIAGWGIYVKLDQYMMLPIQSMGQAVTTFIGQNVGAGKIQRAKNGTWVAFGIIFTVSLCVALTLNIFAPILSSLFSPASEVIEYGVLFIHLCSPFAIVCCFNQVLSGALRGYGDSKAPMIITLCTHVIFRQIYLFFMTKFISNNIYVVGFGYPAGWILCAIAITIYYKFVKIEI
ncbi:MAG: MATE family efflux transporter [Synergistaceae bacterium]|nr:MATE family efflux transporter [Synergistaceae bacterium]